MFSQINLQALRVEEQPEKGKDLNGCFRKFTAILKLSEMCVNYVEKLLKAGHVGLPLSYLYFLS